MKTEKIIIPVEGGKNISGVMNIPDGYDGKSGIIFAHGAANDMNNPMIVFLADHLAQAGYLTLRFNFLYKEEGKSNPDSQELLYKAWESTFKFLQDHPLYGPQEIIAAGKSLGGRIASQMVSERRLPASRLIFLGYPLHAPGKKERIKDSHLYEVEVPMLFFVGTKDQLCDLNLLKGVLSRIKVPWKLETIEGGDHSFNVSKALGPGEEEVYGRMLRAILSWTSV